MTHNMTSIRQSQFRLNEPLAQYTSWRIGGVAEKYYRPYLIDDLRQLLSDLPSDEPLTWLGLGSNVLIRDNCIEGTVIHLLPAPSLGHDIQSPLASITVQDEELVRVGAGVTCAKLAKFCAKQGLGQGAFFAGIPGTVGGALAMNAGAFGGETWSFVKYVEVMNRRGDIKIRYPEDFKVSYRSVTGNIDEWFVAGYFSFPANRDMVGVEITELLRKRNETQPIGSLSCGSVFKNPPHHHAARLIEACGLKGYRIGDAEVSRKHANFILNLGKARASEVEELITYIKERVFDEHHIDLQLEVRMIGK